MNEQDLRQLFRNLSDECKFVRLVDGKPANSMDGYEAQKSVKLMSEDRFIETIKQAKLLHIPAVINRRKLLLAFIEFERGEDCVWKRTKEMRVDMFLASNSL